ncbi:thioredoxin-like [2Fe-2S] ferredoxin-domain-containing protein [Cunninghamella echinulata]|nr:thioredoxin-like [2Fe-2S] ferredoxin-domain-containing protein [Cunninghamella echinulata]
MNSLRTLIRQTTKVSSTRRFIHSAPAVKSDALFIHRDTSENNPNLKFEFDADNKKRIEEILKKYPPQYKKGAIMPLLDLGQRQHGFTSISVMNEVARLLEVPPMRVYEVATFYTMYNRNPVGKYFLQLCTTTPCQLGGCGSTKILDTLTSELGIQPGETTKDGKFTLVEVECAGACVNAPVMAINDDYYEDLTPETTKKLLDNLKSNKPITPGPQSGRHTCEYAPGVYTTLNDEPYGPGFRVREDL